MTATWTPGLPSVVSVLVNSISLPALPPESSWIAPSSGAGGKYRLRSGARTYATLIAGKVVTENHRPVFQGRRETRIVVELRPQLAQRRLKDRHVLQFLAGDGLQ